MSKSALAIGAAHLRWLGSVAQIWSNLRLARRVVDPQYYLAANPDVRASGLSPALHYALYGKAEGRHPAAPRNPPPDVGRLAGAPKRLPSKVRSYDNATQFYDELNPEVTIVVLNFGKSALTLECLDRLWQHTAGHKYEIVVVDNGSPPDEFAVLATDRGKFRLLRLAQNRYFGEGNNLGAETSRAENLMFLNNDAFVTENWLQPLLEVFATHADAGAVGATLLFPNNDIQEAGATIDSAGVAVQRRRGERQEPGADTVEQVDYCSGAALLVRREAFEAVLGFDHAWEPAFYEDVDLCFRLACAGWRTYHCPASQVVHLEHSTTGDHRTGLEGENLVEINRLRFLSRWSEYLVGRVAKTNTGASVWRDGLPSRVSRRSQDPGKPRLGMYTPHVLIPGGGERYLMTMADEAVNFSVTLVTDVPYSRLRLLQLARELGLDLQHVELSTVQRVLERPRFDVFVSMDSFILPSIAGLGERNLYICQFPFPLPPDELSRRWGNLNRYEQVLVYSDYARRHTCAALEALDIEKPPAVDTLLPPVAPVGGGEDFPRGADILSVGRFYAGGHPKRHDAIIEAFRELHQSRPDARLHLAGSLHPEPHNRRYLLDLRKQADGLPVTFHLNASRETIESLYRRASVYWQATGFGRSEVDFPHEMEHFGIAVVEAMSAGAIPICFAGGGVTEVITPGENGLLFRTIQGLCAETLKVIAEPEGEWVRRMRRSAVATSARYSPSVFAESVKRFLSSAPV